jgi:glutaredoxin 3
MPTALAGLRLWRTAEPATAAHTGTIKDTGPLLELAHHGSPLRIGQRAANYPLQRRTVNHCRKESGLSNVVIYTTRVCPYCIRAKALLAKKGVSYSEVDVSNDQEKRVWLVTATGQRTVPQIFINDQPIGGFDDMAALDRKGELDRMLAASPPSASSL